MRFNFKIYDHVGKRFLHDVVIEANSYSAARDLADAYLQASSWKDGDTTISIEEVRDDK